jgi:hypothetical protein
MVDRAPHVGTLREKPLHAALKAWCAADGDRIEHPVDGYVIDIVRPGPDGNLLIEVQTRGFSSMKATVRALLDREHRIRIVYPIPVEKTIVKLHDGGEVTRRRSPKRGEPWDVFGELVSFPDLIGHPGLEIELVSVREDEVRIHRPGKAWRRKGWVVEERRLVDILDSIRIVDAESLLALVPGSLPHPFTTADVARVLGRPRRLAQQATYCLRHAEVIHPVGKVGNAIEYEVVRSTW